MERYRTSLHSTSPINRSNLSEGYVKSNLESRVEYEASQVSLAALIKALVVITCLAGILLTSAWLIQTPAPNAGECAHPSSFAGYLNRVRYRFLGGENPDKCEHTVRKTEDVVGDGKTVQTITSTTTCTTDLDKPVAQEAKSFWSYLRLPFFGCDEYKQHKVALQDQHFSVTGRLPPAPKLEETVVVKKRTTTTSSSGSGSSTSTSTINESMLISPEHLNDITEKFEQLLPNAGLASDSGSAYVSRTEESQIQGVKPLLQDKTVFDLQMKVNDLVHSYQNLRKKRAALDDFRKHFTATAKSPAECANESRELTLKISLEREKLDYTRGSVVNLEAALKDVQNRLNDFIQRQRSDEQEPLRLQAKLEEEIEELRRSIANASKIHNEVDARKRDRNAKVSDLDRVQKQIDSANQDIKNSDLQKNLLRGEIEELYKKLKLSEGKRSLWEVKLELALRNKHIKDFLMSLINTNQGKEKDLQALFVDKIASEKELKVVLREFINQSRSSKNELPITDEQIDSIIKQDEKDFEDITRLYKELVKIITEYKDIDYDISHMRKELENMSHTILMYQADIDKLNKRLGGMDSSLHDKYSYISAREKEIAALRDRIGQDDIYIERHIFNIPDLEAQLKYKRDDLDRLNSQFKVS